MKDWSTVQKGDKLHLLVPMNSTIDSNLIYYDYQYQESEVINVHHYENHINVRFKYTDTRGKRQRVELAINKTKYEEKCVASDKKTGWAAHYEPQYGDILVTYENKEYLNTVYSESIAKEIDKCESYLSDIKAVVNKLRSIQYNAVV